jgi:hypothetical protein
MVFTGQVIFTPDWLMRGFRRRKTGLYGSVWAGKRAIGPIPVLGGGGAFSRESSGPVRIAGVSLPLEKDTVIVIPEPGGNFFFAGRSCPAAFQTTIRDQCQNSGGSGYFSYR